MKIIFYSTTIAAFLFSEISFSQNISINTDGTSGENGVMLDVKGTNSISTTAAQNVFQVKSFDASASALKLRLILGTNATAGSRYAGLEAYDAGASAYRALALQPNGGNVGIGTTSPSSTLTVYNGGNGINNLRVESGSAMNYIDLVTHTAGGCNYTTELRFSDNGSVKTEIVGQSNGDLQINPSGTGNLIVGSNQCNPGQKLYVSGNIYSTADVITSCGASLNALAGCSDIRYKTDIDSIKNVLSDVMKLQGVKYNWRQDEFPDMHFNNRRQIGFIAQEIEKIFPELVNTGETGYKSVEYAKLTSVLVEAIKEQQKTIEELKNANANLDSRVKALEQACQAQAKK